MIADLQRCLWPKGPRADIWALVDGARDPRVYHSLVNSFLNYSCLYAGPLPVELEMVAPYLVQLDPDDKFTTFLVNEWGNSLCVFLQCDTSLKELRHHLRRFLTVRDTTGRKLLFRYYDPRVLRIYLPTCDAMDMKVVFGPIQSYWTESADATQLVQFHFDGKKLNVEPHSIGAPVSAKVASITQGADIVFPQPALVMQKGVAAPRRTPVLLQGAGVGARLTRSSECVRLFRSPTADRELAFVNNEAELAPAGLEPDITLYAEPAALGKVTLSLDLNKGGAAVREIEVIELSLQTGLSPADQYNQGICAGLSTRRRIVVAGTSYKGRLALRASGPIRVFRGDDAASAAPLPAGNEFSASRQDTVFWVEAEKISTKPGDARLQLCLADGDNAADWCPVTCVDITTDGASVPPVLLIGSVDAANPIVLEAVTKPAIAHVHWHAVRDPEDSAAVIAASPRPLPDVANGRLTAGAAGTFRIVAATAPEGWGGPSSSFEVIFVHAALEDHQCAFDSKFCACGPDPVTKRFSLHAGKDPAVRLTASIRLTGGGPAGERGVDSVKAAWVNKVISDNSGARYKTGSPVKHIVEDGGDTVLLQSEVTPGPPLQVAAHYAPGVSYPAANPSPIEQIWSYLECRSSLVLWTEEAPERRAVLLHAGWSFTGDYMCTPAKVGRAAVKARLAGTGTLALPVPESTAAAGIGVIEELP